jgi:hypothetical protein
MKSALVDRFNHDRRAATYDENVKNESNPVPTGYRNLLNSIALRGDDGSRQDQDRQPAGHVLPG